MKLYQIKDWQKYYEASDNKKTDGPLSWVAVRTKTDGLGFRRVAAQKNRSDLFSAWHLMVGLAAKQPRETRGQLARNGKPLTPVDMEMMTGWPAKVFSDALSFFSAQEQQWLEVVDVSEPVRTETDEIGQTPTTLPTIPTNITIPTLPEPASPSDVVPPFTSAEFSTAWADFTQHRKELKKKLTPTAVKQNFSDFAKWGEQRSIDAIRFTIGKNWVGIAEDKNRAQGHGFPRPELNGAQMR